MKSFVSLEAGEFIVAFNKLPNAVLLDVRTVQEFSKFHFQEAVNIPCTERHVLLNLNKETPYFVHCLMGGRSAMVALMLVEEGFKYVFNLNDSYNTLKRWSKGECLKRRKKSHNGM